MASNASHKYEIELFERVGFKDLPVSLIVLNPYKEIDDALGRDDYFGAFAVAVSYFEYYGYRKLRNFFKNQIAEEKLERLGASEIALFLFGLNIIDQPTYAKMTEVIGKRNDLVHPRGDISLKYRLNKAEANSLLEKAKQCIEVLSK